jgi:hypothetical protein
MTPIRKYPRTRHIEGSRLGPGDEDLEAAPFSEVEGRFLVVEEKIDGANSAVSFDEEGRLYLQSRGHYLTGGAREKHFAALKPWAHAHARTLFERLGSRHVMYGEWTYAKHTVFYDALPHYFLEFDILDRDRDAFLSTARRRALLARLPIVSVPVLAERSFRTKEDLVSLVGPSRFKTKTWRERLTRAANEAEVDVTRAVNETDPSDEMEGLYIKVEDDDQVLGRYKWVRKSFLTSVVDSGSHWLARPISRTASPTTDRSTLSFCHDLALRHPARAVLHLRLDRARCTLRLGARDEGHAAGRHPSRRGRCLDPHADGL